MVSCDLFSRFKITERTVLAVRSAGVSDLGLLDANFGLGLSRNAMENVLIGEEGKVDSNRAFTIAYLVIRQLRNLISRGKC